MLFRYIGLVLLVTPPLVGCGQSDAMPAHPRSPAMQLRAKLNAMSVPDRLAYIKKHPGTVQAMVGASASWPKAKMPKAAASSSPNTTKSTGG
jgi:hypothetical protein